MTWAGLDCHARSTHAAAIDIATGELKRARFGPGNEEVVSWLAELPQPIHAYYEAGPTGFALYRAVRSGITTTSSPPARWPAHGPTGSRTIARTPR